jgi:putative two-component system hydrogenase maturation factor HypX/HoxX
MKILLLASAFNGLTQRAWLELRAAGHEVSVELSVSSQGIGRPSSSPTQT